MEIYSSRCVIRPFRADEVQPFMAYRNDAEWMKYQGFKGLTKEVYEKALLGTSSLSEGIQLAVVSKATNTLIGDIYLKQEMRYFGSVTPLVRSTLDRVMPSRPPLP